MSYFGQLMIDGNAYLVGSTLFGECRTAAGTSAKLVTSGVLGNTFDQLIPGITVNIQFIQGSTTENITLKIGSTAALPVQGNCKCNANAVLSFTYNTVSGIDKWILNAGEKTSTTVMQTYDSTSSEPISGRGVAEAIAPLVPGGNSAANYSVDTEIGNNPSGAKVPTTLAVVNYVDQAFSSKYAMIYKGTIGISGNRVTLPSSNYTAGFVYKVADAGTYAGQRCEVGDLIIATSNANETDTGIINSHWTIVHTNISVQQTYNSTSTDPISGAGVKDAIDHIRLPHSITFGAGGAYTYDGSADVVVPVYDGTII